MPELIGIDLAAVEAWMVRVVEHVAAPFRWTRISGGHSNLTYKVQDAGGRSFALRRPPLGSHSGGAHDVLREHRIQQALQGSVIPVPRMIAACADASVTGAPFYLMDWAEGSIVDRAECVAALLPDEASRRRMAYGLIDTLADLHRVDVDAVGLGTLGPREDQLSRNLERMRKVWERTRTRELPLIDELHARLVAARPVQRHTGLVHSDFRPGNVILDADGAIVAILDWELAALGDVLVDVGGLLANWDEPGDPWPDVWMQRAPTRAGGFPSRRELLVRYASRTGFDVSGIDYYRAFNYWRIAVIAEGMKRRYETGALSAQDARAEDVARRVLERARMAERCLALVGA